MLLLLLFINLISGAVLNYTLNVNYKWMTVDNFTKAVIAVNDMDVGPTIRGNLNDIVNIKVINSLWQGAITTHFHGIHLPGVFYYDGVPGITQCGIEAGTNMTYTFQLTNPGTHWIHSHVEGTREDAFYCAFIVEDPKEKFNYDEEHIIFISDFHKQYIEEEAQILHSKPFKWLGEPFRLLVNGLTDYNISVIYNKTYLFRFISATAHSFVNISFPGHNLTIVEVEGTYTKPAKTQHLWINAGQRYTVLLHANNPGCYYVNVSSMSDPIYTLFGLKYNSVNCNSTSFVSSINNEVFNTSILEDKYPVMLPTPNKNMTITMRILVDHEGGKTFAYNNISFKFPPEPLILSYYDGMLNFDNETQIIPVEVGDVIDIDLANYGIFQHSHHIHLHSFYVLDSPNPIRRDTITVHERSSAKIRIVFDNPSICFAHCHSSWHSIQRLQMVFAYPPETIPRPPEDFLICGKRLNQRNEFEIPVYVLGAAVFVVSIFLITAVFYICRIKGQTREHLPLVV